MKIRIPNLTLGDTAAIIALILSLLSIWELIIDRWVRVSGPACDKDVKAAFFSLASLLGFSLGYWVFNKIPRNRVYSLVRRDWEAGHVGELIAVLSMSLATPALVLTISSTLAMWPESYRQHFRETDAIRTLRTIHSVQAQYQAMKDRFGTLKDLANAGLIESDYANGQSISDYGYSFSDVRADTYCARAYRVSPACGGLDFIVCEDGEIRFARTATTNILKRGEGMPLIPRTDPLPTP